MACVQFDKYHETTHGGEKLDWTALKLVRGDPTVCSVASDAIQPWQASMFDELVEFVTLNPMGLKFDKLQRAPLSAAFKRQWEEHVSKGLPISITTDIILTLGDLGNSLNVEDEDVPPHIRAHKVERALWRKDVDVEVQTYFFFDERKQVFHAAEGVKASTLCELYFSRACKDGVKERVSSDGHPVLVPSLVSPHRQLRLVGVVVSQIINCFEMSNFEGKKFTSSQDALIAGYR